MDRVCFGSPIEYWLKSAVILRMFKPNRNLQKESLPSLEMRRLITLMSYSVEETLPLLDSSSNSSSLVLKVLLWCFMLGSKPTSLLFPTSAMLLFLTSFSLMKSSPESPLSRASPSVDFVKSNVDFCFRSFVKAKDPFEESFLRIGEILAKDFLPLNL
jgi:hypothetical protein